MWSLNNLVSQSEAAKEHLASVFNQSKEKESQKNEGGTGATEGKEEAATTEKESQSLPTPTSAPTPTPTIASIPPKKGNIEEKEETHNINMNWDAIKSGWGNVVNATKEVTKEAIGKIEEEQTKIQARLFQKGPYKRDLNLPLDTASLRDAEVVYITDKLITMGHPGMQSAVDGDITPERKLAAIAHLLQKRHQGKYMVWNLSELEYDYSVLDDQVMTFEFPGSPSPPLGLLMKILMSIESWLKADPKNVAVMHCLTGRGRTSTVMSAFLCWMGEAGFVNPNRALEYMAQCKKLDLETLTIPSQRRYVGYFSNMLDGVKPSQPPLLLKRILMSEAPKFEKYQPIQNDNDNNENHETTPDPLAEHAGKQGCAPYLQIFKAGKLVFTTAASKSFHQSKDDLPFCFPSEKSITFPVETVVQGDILIRCRHLTRKGKRVSMFRAAMHTGYVPPKVMRLRKSEIDGACSDKRYADDFFIDLVFEECNASMASKHLLSGPGNGSSGEETEMRFNGGAQGDVKNEASVRRMAGTVAGAEGGGAVTVTASAYDSMLHRDSRFWDAIAQRRNEKSKAGGNSAGTSTEPTGDENVSSVFYGPTIGRRREFPDEAASSKVSDGDDSGTFSIASQKSALQSFTIGGELDFTLDDNDTNNTSTAVKEAPAKMADVSTADKKDDLMDALMAIDDVLDDDDDDEVRDDDVEGNSNDGAFVNNADISQNPQEEIENEAVHEHLNATMTEEIIFENTSASNSNTSIGENIAEVEKIEEIEMVEDAVSGEFTSEQGSKDSPKDDGMLLNLDSLNLDDLDDTAPTKDGEDGFDFSDDDDDDELADLEEFLMKATS